MNRGKSVAIAMVCVIAMMATTLGQASVTAASVNSPIGGGSPAAPQLTAAQAAHLQKRVNEVLAAIPGGKQVSPTQIKYDGLDITVDPFYSEKSFGVNEMADISCPDGYFCILVRGTMFNFYTCRMWDLANWSGLAPYKNWQTSNTLAMAWDNDWVVRFRNWALDSGTADVNLWRHFKPCGN